MKPRRRADLRDAERDVLAAAERWTDASADLRVVTLSTELLAAVARMRMIRDQKPSEPPGASSTDDEEPTEPRGRAPR